MVDGERLVGLFFGVEDGHFGKFFGAPMGDDCSSGKEYDLRKTEDSQNGFTGEICRG